MTVAAPTAPRRSVRRRRVKGPDLLAASGLTRSFDGRTVVWGVDIVVEAGEVVGLFGPSGSGKSTVFGMIAGAVEPDDGDVTLNGVTVGPYDVAQRAGVGLAYLPQAPHLFAGLTVEQNLTLAVEGRARNAAAAATAVAALLDLHGLAAHRTHRVATLSGGERKLCELAFVLSTQPRFLLLDEPLTGLDPIVSAAIRHRIREVAAGGIGVLVTDHKVRDALDVVDRAYIIDGGTIIAAGTPARLKKNRAVISAYLGRSHD